MTAADNTAGDLDTATGLYGLDSDDNSYLVVCPVCEGEREAFATRFSPVKTTCRECGGLGEVSAP